MALTTTTLAGAIQNDDLNIGLTSPTGFVAGNPMIIDNEYIGAIISVNGSSVYVRTRGDAGTLATAHGNLASVTTGPAVEMPSPPLQPFPPRATLDADGAIVVDPLATGSLLFVIMKATAAALTLVGPSKGQNGLRVEIRSGTAAAHTVTYTAGFYGDTTSSDVATYAAKVGASMTIEANDGNWGPVALANVTLA